MQNFMSLDCVCFLHQQPEKFCHNNLSFSLICGLICSSLQSLLTAKMVIGAQNAEVKNIDRKSEKRFKKENGEQMSASSEIVSYIKKK